MPDLSSGIFTLARPFLRTGRVTSQIDHIVVSRFGIFVIETKNLSGWIFGLEQDSLRCACNSPEGGKVPMEFDECKALADRTAGPEAHR